MQEAKPPVFEKWEKVNEDWDFSKFQELKKGEHFAKPKEIKSNCRLAIHVADLQKL